MGLKGRHACDILSASSFNYGREDVMPTISEASQAAAPALTFRWTDLLRSIFSFPVMCIFLLSALIFEFCDKQLAEPDIWWHLRDAQNLIEYHSFSRADTYSFTAAGLSRANFEWLSEIPYYLGFKTWGLQGLLLVSIVVSVLIFAGVYYLCCRAGANYKDAIIATMLAIFLGTISLGPRMLLFGWLCMVALLILLEEYRRTGRGLWLIPPLFLLWVNLHGSWAFGMVVLAIFVLSGLVEGEWGLIVARRWSRSQLRDLLLAGVASFVLLFVNPFGYKLVLYPFEVALRQQIAMQHVEEWQPLDLSTGHGRLGLLVIFAILASALVSRRRWRLDAALLTAFALWTALSHGRFLFFLGLVIAPALALRLHLFPAYERDRDKPWLNAGVIAGIIVALFFLFPSTVLLQQKVDHRFPTAALLFMREHQLSGRVFNQYAWGGYMEWDAPELKSFIDGRADVFVANGVFKDYAKVSNIVEPLEVLDKYRIDYALLEQNRPLTYVLEHSTVWRPIYSDPVAVLFARSTSEVVGSAAQPPSEAK
jgi:hypothetical protein